MLRASTKIIALWTLPAISRFPPTLIKIVLKIQQEFTLTLIVNALKTSLSNRSVV